MCGTDSIEVVVVLVLLGQVLSLPTLTLKYIAAPSQSAAYMDMQARKQALLPRRKGTWCPR